jgi:sugar porter (SP) family MFS transporter
MIGRINKRLAVSVIASSSCGLLFGYDIGAISSSTQELRTCFALSAFALGIAVASALVGTITGSASAGFLTDAIGRRATLLIAGGLYAIAALGTALAFGFAQFAISRFGCGIAIGLISVAAPMYLAEIAPSNLRGRLVGSFQINISIGVVLGFALGYFFSLHSQNGTAWRYSMGCGVLPALLCDTLLLQAVPSPRWLALKRRFAEARNTLAAVGSIDPEADQECLAASIREFGALRRSKFFSRRYARPILLAACLVVFNQLTGVNVLLYYVLDIFTEFGSGRLNGRKDAILVSAFSLLVTTVAVSVIDKVGRKPLLLAGAAGMSACLIALPAIRYMGWPATSVLVVLLCYNLFFGFSQGTVVWVYLSEIFPLPVRARGQSFGSTVLWMTNALIVGSFPAIAIRVGGMIFVALAILMAIQCVLVILVYPETRRSSLETLASNITS